MEEIREEFEFMVNSLRKIGLRTIASSTEEPVRKLLLRMMEELEAHEIRVKKSMELTESTQAVVFLKDTNEDKYPENIVKHFAPKVKVLKDDDNK